MTQSGGRLWLLCISLVLVISGITLAKGGLYVDRHEGDTLHLIEIVRRMGLGQWPHLDFSTPLGLLNFLPISVFVGAGFGVGVSILLGQVLFVAILLPAIWWTCWSRVPGRAAYVVAGVSIVTCLAMIHGETDAHVSMSMHYNRWAWVLAALAVALAGLNPIDRSSAVADGVIIGAAMLFFILGKVTYGVAFAPALIVALVLRKAWRTFAIGVGVVAAGAILVTVLGGIEFWVTYVGDLLRVGGSDIRPRAGEDWASLVLAPRFLIPNLALVAGIVFLRKGDNPDLGLVLTLLAPAFLYVTYQNYGNDPKWLAILALLLWAGAATRRSRILALLSAALIAPSVANMAISPVRHFLLPETQYQSAFVEEPHTDFFTLSDRVGRVLERRPVQFDNTDFASLNGSAEQNNPIVFKGEAFPECVQTLGLFGVMQAIADDLSAFGVKADQSVFTADTFGSFWLFGDLKPGQGAAPWYYGDLTGYEDGSYVLFPTCPATPRAMRAIVKDLTPHEDNLREVRRTELYVLYEKI